ncbi:MAG: molybdate ABC transporter substrate-binding protein [Epsilonproteobacteria bacterium]|nr:molybdate ABC transporter substrate-binding protein [Campylobacterota bacterium]
MRFKILILLFILFNFLSAGEIKIAVAANVSYAIDELKSEFNKIYPETKVQVILGSTGKLTAQIKNQAPYHIFMGANMDYPETLYKEGFAITKPKVYAKGSLAYLSLKERDFSKGIELLKSNEIKKIAIANPKTAPYGIATVEALKNANIYDDIKNKFIYGESISQTVIYTLRATDIGIIAKSALYSPKMKNYKEGINWESVDTKLYTPIKQGIVVLKNGQNSKEAMNFYNFIFSPKAKEIFENFGYIVDE